MQSTKGSFSFVFAYKHGDFIYFILNSETWEKDWFWFEWIHQLVLLMDKYKFCVQFALKKKYLS